jgi:hypothetical protein
MRDQLFDINKIDALMYDAMCRYGNVRTAAWSMENGKTGAE